jgi:hypothetical protein
MAASEREERSSSQRADPTSQSTHVHIGKKEEEAAAGKGIQEPNLPHPSSSKDS